MDSDDAQYDATNAHLDRFVDAIANLESRGGQRSQLEQLEIEALRAQADDLRDELTAVRLRVTANLTARGRSGLIGLGSSASEQNARDSDAMLADGFGLD